MIERTRTLIFRFPAHQWIRESIQRRALRIKMLREVNALRNLSDEHLRDIGLHRSGIDGYIADLYESGFRR